MLTWLFVCLLIAIINLNEYRGSDWMSELIHVMNLSNEERENHEYWMKEAMKEALKAQ